MQMKTASTRPEDEFIPTRASLLGRLKDWDDSRSWSDFFNTYWRLIYGRARRAELTEQEAQEVVQETIIAVAKKMESFKYDPSVASFKTWLYQIVTRRIADQFRRRGRGVPIAEALPEDAEGASFLDSTPDPASLKPDAAWERDWEANLIAAAVERVKEEVSPEHFQIYEYHILQDHTASETAQALQTNAAKIYWVKHRVGAKLAKAVEQLRKKPL